VSGCLPLWVKGGCRRQVDGTAGLPSAPEMPCAPRQLRLVPEAEIRTGPLLSLDLERGVSTKPSYQTKQKRTRIFPLAPWLRR
jgi:hypothetical protein